MLRVTMCEHSATVHYVSVVDYDYDTIHTTWVPVLFEQSTCTNIGRGIGWIEQRFNDGWTSLHAIVV